MREKSGVFGEATDEYEAARSGYPDQLVLDILDFANPVHHALEIGAGTGKATRSFLGRGFELACLEPDPRMAAVLSRVTSEQSSITVVESNFEAWQSTKKFDLVFAAQSWHWVDPERRLNLAHDALAEHGTLAMFWNRYAPISQELQTTLLKIDRRHEVDPTIHTPHEHSADFYSGDIVIEDGTPEYQLSQTSMFFDFTSRRYRRIKTFPKSLYLDLLTSISAYRMLEDSKRDEYLQDVEQILDENGGSITLSISSDLFLAKRS
jgi:SAM-dependent methyltransferase